MTVMTLDQWIVYEFGDERGAFASAARYIGISQSTLRNIMAGRRGVGPEVEERIKEATQGRVVVSKSRLRTKKRKA